MQPVPGRFLNAGWMAAQSGKSISLWSLASLLAQARTHTVSPTPAGNAREMAVRFTPPSRIVPRLFRAVLCCGRFLESIVRASRFTVPLLLSLPSSLHFFQQTLRDNPRILSPGVRCSTHAKESPDHGNFRAHGLYPGAAA